ncbi:MAG: helix-turn-helix transcriptional regulator [Candidatus Competibacteraceae bacterium]|jgi:transcriptional regulator with XRE-family HTH domain|nr:helix-turn-helix transcriptional regulator [Candidatus Competibacteraceae bacterium]
MPKEPLPKKRTTPTKNTAAAGSRAKNPIRQSVQDQPQLPPPARPKRTVKKPVKPAVSAASPTPPEPTESFIKKLTSLPGAVAGGAYRLAIRTTEVPLKIGKAFLNTEQAEMMEEAGNTLKDLREVAGLTRDELSDALNLKDRSLVEAIENGTAIMSFELILRLAAVLARHDPVPVVLKFTRTYNPELWKLLQDWGFGRLSLNYEREREFINIYRRHDAARLLSDEGFEKVLDFTRAAFEMALHFAAEQENIESDE